MKILRAMSSANPKIGGPIEGTLNSSREMVSLGHQVEILCVDSPASNFIREFDIPCHATGSSLSFYEYNLNYKKWLSKNINQFDCVIIQGIWRYHSIATRQACLKHNIPYFVFTHGMLDPWFKKKYPLKHLKKWLFWPWGDYRVLRDANAVLFTTEKERLLARQSFRLYKAKEKVVGYGIEGFSGKKKEKQELFYQKFPMLLGKPFFLFLSRIHHKKGCDLLVNAFISLAKKHPHWSLVIAGPDQINLKSELEKTCIDNNVSKKVIWTGMLSGDLKWGAFLSANAFVLPSHSENFGIVVAEALSCSTPVLITDKVNIWREVFKENAGLVEKDDLTGTSNLLNRFIALTNEEKLKMQNNARVCFDKHFHVKKAAENLLQAISNPNIVIQSNQE